MPVKVDRPISVDRSSHDPLAWLALAALLIVMLALSWERWTSPLIDHGREMNLPARILAGEQLYQDLQYLYGPFAPYFNAFLYWVFGLRLATLHGSGMACAALILWITYWLARRLMNTWEAALATGLVLVICALKYTANYVQPYAYGALYGLVFALAALGWIARYLHSQRSRWLGWAGICAGWSLISKPELAAAVVAAFGAALLLGLLSGRRRLWRDAALFALPLVIIVVAAYGLILSRVPWRVLLEDNHLLFTNVPPQLVYFNRHLSGLADWPRSLATVVAAASLWLGVCGLCALIGSVIAQRRLSPSQPQGTLFALRRAAIATAGGLLVWAVAVLAFKARAEASPLAGAPLVLLAVIGVGGWRWWRARDAREPVSWSSSWLWVLAVFGLALIARVFLNVTISGPYAPFCTPPLIIIFLYLLFRLAPNWLTSSAEAASDARRVAKVMIALSMVALMLNTAARFRSRHTYELSTPRGRLLTTPALGPPFAAAIRFVETHTAASDEVAVLPQGTSINFLTGRAYPLREEIVLPGLLSGEREAEAIQRLQARRVPLILVINSPAAEFQAEVFGAGYNQTLMRWIQAHYQVTARFDSDTSRQAHFGDPSCFILAYERRPQ